MVKLLKIEHVTNVPSMRSPPMPGGLNGQLIYTVYGILAKSSNVWVRGFDLLS
jgi:hypothetical protein